MKLLIYASLISIAMMLGFALNSDANHYQIPFDLNHFSYHNENNIMQRMQLAPKIGIRFRRALLEGEQKKFLAAFPSISQDKDKKDSSRIFLSFPKTIKDYDIVRILSEIAVSDIAEAVPVFVIDNIEAIVDGIVIEPKIILPFGDIERRIKRFGEFTGGAVIRKEHAWIFPITAVQPPLNLFLLINLVHEDEWIRRAHPLFQYLHDPITSVITVHPPSGTVNELRTLTLSLRIYDPKIEIDENSLPTFGEGRFVPMKDNKSAPAYLFEVVSERKTSRINREQGTELIYSWKFAHYALGEWIIPPQPIGYVVEGIFRNIDTPTTTLVVTSLIGQLAIHDMPVPRLLPIDSMHPVADMQDASLPALPVYWFDAWIADLMPVLKGLAWILSVCGAASLFVGASCITTRLKRRHIQDKQRQQFQAQIDVWRKEAAILCSYAPLMKASSAILKRAFPHLGRNQEYHLLKEDNIVHTKLGSAIETVIQPLYEEFDNRYKKNVIITADDIERALSKLQKLQLLLDPLIQFSEEDHHDPVA